MITHGLNKKRLVMWSIILALAVMAGCFLAHQVAIDRCLDGGGRWNYERGECEYGPPGPR